MKNIKVFVVGSSTGYAHWMINNTSQLTKKMEDADLVVLTGGADINPQLYQEKPGKYTYFSENRDVMEVEAVIKARALNKKIWGTCRGLQLLTALNGGKLIQHISHGGSHLMITEDGSRVNVNSLHHQMCYPFDIPKENYRILGYAPNISPTYLNGDNNQIELPENFVEPEMIIFGKNEMGVQYHPEMMSEITDGFKKTYEYFEKFMNNEL